MAIEPFLGTTPQKGFLATVVLQAIIVLTMVAISFGWVDSYVDLSESRYRTIPCYLALFALAEIFEIIVTVDALKLRNIIQLIGICVFHVCMIVFSALQVHQTHTALVTNPDGSCVGDGYVNCDGHDSLFWRIRSFLIVSPCILGASLLVLVYFTWELFHEFGWVVFHIVGANPLMKTMYRYYQVLICLLKFDFFISTALTMQLLILVLSRDGAEFPLTIIAIPVVLVLLVFCAIAVKREIKWLMGISLVLMIAAQAYFLYKFSRLFAPSSRDAYTSTRATLGTFCIVAFLMLFATFAVGIRCLIDFDKDLIAAKNKDMHLDDEKRPTSNYSVVAAPLPGTPNAAAPGAGERVSSYTGGSALTPRMSIE